MTTANNLKNQNPNGLGNLGQISDFPEWVVVEGAGTDNEDIWSDHYSFKAALKELEGAGGTDNGFDIMKRLADGTLTTEF